jgi:hypothetical protein
MGCRGITGLPGEEGAGLSSLAGTGLSVVASGGLLISTHFMGVQSRNMTGMGLIDSSTSIAQSNDVAW